MTKPQTPWAVQFRAGASPEGVSMKRFSAVKMACIVIAFCAVAAIASPAQTFTSIASLGLANGDSPNGLVQGTNGDFYGATTFGGPNVNDFGTVFEVTPAGEVTRLHAFFCSSASCAAGSLPNGGLLLAANGNFYGSTSIGGAKSSSQGTVFEITPAGKLTTIYSFCAQFNCADGESPSGLVQATDGNFYGTTPVGGAYNFGTVFKLTPAGKLTTLYSFCPGGNGGNCPDGRNPSGGLIQAANGNFYGTTNEGGANGFAGGTIFEITPAGNLTTLYSFCAEANCADGASPNGLIQATNGNFYGVTYAGGAVGCNNSGCGTIYEMTPTGTLTTLYSFCVESGCPTGPASLVQATDGNFYGTSIGGTYDEGTVFEFAPTGSFTTLYNFCPQAGCADGELPRGVLQATDGTFYGTTSAGGANNGGTVFSLSVGLGPFVKTVPVAGKVKANVIVLGNNLTGTTKVSFNGTAATFTVVSDTEITATVPTGATTGKIVVTTPSGKLKSNLVFRVTS
jgi:uncharacterized repeat protein (TIGR03803 family)